MNNKKIIVVGAGITGLVAAIELEKQGYSPFVIDKNNVVGGRLATAFHEGVPLDIGFQVLLTAYPEAKRYLNYSSLNLKYFLPGAVIHHENKKTLWGDPLRNFFFLKDTLLSNTGNVIDKLKIFILQRQLKSKSLERIFKKEETTTIDYLYRFGFSETVINNFFQPFFAGIYLEEALTTSSRLFEFVFKMFAEGHAAIPAKGIQAIAEQLKNQLTQTKFMLATEVKTISSKQLILASGKKVAFDKCIYTIPTEFDHVKWKSCENLYFEIEKQKEELNIIGLFTHQNKLVNNYHFVTSLYPHAEKSIISVTIIKHHQHTDSDLIQLVKEELHNQLGLTNLQLIKHYRIPKALPQITNLKYKPKKLRVENDVIYTGDYTVQGSINSAMLAGKRAVELACNNLSLIIN